MLEERGIVVAIAENGQVSVVTERQSGCGNCQNEKSCGTNVLTKPSSRQQVMVVNANGHLLAKGDIVLLAVDETVIWHGMLLLYVWPLFALVVGAIFGDTLAGDLGAIMGAFSGLTLALTTAHWRTQREQDNYLPIVIKKLT